QLWRLGTPSLPAASRRDELHRRLAHEDRGVEPPPPRQRRHVAILVPGGRAVVPRTELLPDRRAQVGICAVFEKELGERRGERAAPPVVHPEVWLGHHGVEERRVSTKA